MLKQLKETTVIVLDNAPTHCHQLNKAPNSSAKKADIIAWLTQNNIQCDPKMKVKELKILVQQNKPKCKSTPFYGHRNALF